MATYLYMMTSSAPPAAGMKFIGRTSRELEDKLKEQLRRAMYEKHRKNPLHVAVREHGPQTFSISLLKELPDGTSPEEITHRELELIVKHDAVRKGWNRPSGSVGSSVRRIDPDITKKRLSYSQTWKELKAVTIRVDRLFKHVTSANYVLIRKELRNMHDFAHALLMASLDMRPPSLEDVDPDNLDRARLIEELYGPTDDP